MTVAEESLPEPVPPTRLRRAIGRAGAAWLSAVGFATAYAIANTAIVALALTVRDTVFGHRALAVLETFLLGSFFAGMLAWMLAAALLAERPPTARFAGMLVFLAIGTAGLAAFVYFLRFRVYFAAGHDPFPSPFWFIQNLFTGASAAYVFATIGLRLLLPAGLLTLFGGAVLFMRYGDTPPRG